MCKILCKKGTDEIVDATSRAGELINEVTLAMKHGIRVGRIGHNIHSYPWDVDFGSFMVGGNNSMTI
jgi:pyruvate/2-oxoglutarate dehydrogenase complex dihydrolipoamide dehydrogenase (E3) component